MIREWRLTCEIKCKALLLYYKKKKILFMNAGIFVFINREIIVRLCSWGVDPHKWDHILTNMTAEQYSLRV